MGAMPYANVGMPILLGTSDGRVIQAYVLVR